MAKLVLGRNLGELLHDREKKSGDPFAADAAPLSSGVRSLMRGQAPGVPVAASPASSKSPLKQGFPGWYLFGADILLAALAIVIVGKSPHPLTWQREVFCASAVALGACLALGAVLQDKAEG
jgi:hypothetical protein